MPYQRGQEILPSQNSDPLAGDTTGSKHLAEKPALPTVTSPSAASRAVNPYTAVNSRQSGAHKAEPGIAAAVELPSALATQAASADLLIPLTPPGVLRSGSGDDPAVDNDIENRQYSAQQTSSGPQASPPNTTVNSIHPADLSDESTPRFDSTGNRQAASPDLALTGTGMPAPLLPPDFSGSSSKPITKTQTPAVAADTGNEVHVHIGRIEVTALPPSGPSRRKKKVAPQPMSLDEYLAARQRN